MKTKETKKNAANQVSLQEAAQHRSKMMWMMGLCCGAPILVVVAISAFGFQSANLGYLILLICLIVMVFMMFMMHGEHEANGSKKSQACCPPTRTNKEPTDKVRKSVEVIKPSTAPKQ